MASYVVGNSRALLELSIDDVFRLDREPWVFACNHFLAHWKIVGFRPSVWLWGDNQHAKCVEWAAEQFRAWVVDPALQARTTRLFAAVEEYPRELELAVQHYAVPVRLLRRGQPWQREQTPASRLEEPIYHHGSTLTDLVNMAWILNPGEEIRVIGNEYDGPFGHFYDPGAVNYADERAGEFWGAVQAAMWTGLGDLRHLHGLPILDCNPSHGRQPPGDVPRAPLFG